MEFEDNQEIDVCDDSMNNEYPEKVDQSKYNDDQGISVNRESIYLSASDLFRLRRDVCKNKGKDENVDVTKGLKLYTPSDSSQNRETMENLLLNHKNSLKLPRGAKIRDCVKGEWNEELKVAIVPHLKGKSTQHMGHNFKGKIALSPEEALFLLEKNSIEVSRNNMPMSIEEAFTVMLKEKFALEKYQVYSHLSQQGFIVVQHQTRIGPRYEEIMNLSKKKQRKRKATNLDKEEPGEKRLTFTGVLASNIQSKVTVNAEESILSSDCEVLNSNDFVNKTDTVAKDCNVVKTTVHVNANELFVSVSSQGGAVLPGTTNQTELMDLNENDSLKSLSCDIENENNSLKSPSVAFENENDLIKNSFVAVEKEKDSLKCSSGVIGKINDSLESPSGAIEKGNDSLKSSFGAIEKGNDSLKSSCGAIEKGDDSLKSPPVVTENENNSLKSSSAIAGKETDSLKSLSGATETKNDSLNNLSGITENKNDALRSPTGVIENENDLLKISSCVTEKENGSFKIPSDATENENDLLKSSSGVTEKENVSLKSLSVTTEATNKLKTASDDHVSSVDSEILSILGTCDSAVKVLENMDVPEVDDNKQKANSCIEISENEVSTELKEMELTDSSIKPPENIAVQDVIEELNGDNTNKIYKSSDDKNEIEVENINDINEIIIDSCHEFDKSENINVDTLSSNYDHDYSSDESISLVCEDESESADVLSCTSNDQDSSFDDIISQSSDIYTPKDHDDEITLIEIRKKENTPLAVIDLLSDDEQEAEKNDETFEGSDDEIQVVKVCNVANSSARNSSRNLSSIKSECKNENTLIRSSNEIKSSFRPQMKFPEMFRKDVLCLPRPPANLLPNHVRPAKEAYVINRNKSAQPNKGRLWNSFRDMQEYQRERRRERQSNNSRPFNSLRDFRFQNDSHHNNRMSPFNQQENSRDSGFDRNNQNYGFQQTASPFNPPMSMSPQLTRGPNLLPSPNVFTTPNQLPFMNYPSLHNLSSTNPVAFVNEFQKTVYSVATNMLSSMLGQHLNPMNPATRSSPTFSEPLPFMGHNSHNQYNNFASQSPMVQDHMAFNANSVSDNFHPVRFPSEPTFSGERFPSPMNRGSMFENNWRPNNFRPRNFERKGPLFPCPYREVRRKRCWGDVKAAVAGSIDNPSDSGSDIEEVPINLNQFLWSNDIQPLVKPGPKLPVSEVLQKLQITQKANLLDTKRNVEKYMPQPPTLEISFDVYLPGSKYKKTSPGVPKHRIVVLRSADPIPKYSELVFLQKKWNDEAVIQMAIVDHGDISFYSFNNVDLNGLVPHEE